MTLGISAPDTSRHRIAATAAKLSSTVGRYATILLGLSVILLIWIGTTYNIQNDRQQARTEAQQNITNLARVFEEQIIRAISATDQILLYIRDAYAKSPKDFDMSLWSYNSDFMSGFTFQIAIIGADGYLVASNLGPTRSAVNLSDREHFAAHATTNKDELFISKPVTGRVSGKASIQLTRRIILPDGTFGGVVVISVDPAYLSQFYQTIDIGRDGTVALIGRDGLIRAYAPETPSKIGTALKDNKLFGELDTKTSGTYVEQIDGIDRLMGYRQVRGYPLIVQIGMALKEVGDQNNGTTSIGIAAALTAWMLLCIGLILRYQASLAKARDTAETGLRTRSEFLAMMSHEIRTPINAVLGLAATLLETSLDSSQRTSVKAIHDSGDSLLEILNDILDLSKLEAGRMSFEAIVFETDSVTQSALDIIGTHASGKGLSVRIERDPSVPLAVTGDAARIRQILLNLLGNAVKFTERGEIVISIRCLNQSDGMTTIEWAVSDTGIGIPPERIDSLFENFIQADNSISRRFGGSGLGLAICKRLLTEMGGDIAVTSTLGSGSTFRFHLTLPISAPPVATLSREDQTAYAELKIWLILLGRPLRILIADDNATNRLVVTKMLQEFDIQLSMAFDGAEAVATASRFPFDAIFMDMRMPQMDGIAATKAIRARGGALARIPIIALTANAFADDRKACEDAGMDDFLAKPVRKQNLVEAILRAMAKRKLSNDAPDRPPSDDITRADAEPVMDLDVLASFTEEVGQDGVAHIFGIFIRDTEKRLGMMRDLSSSGDRDKIENEAHAMKGAAATFGFRQLSMLARGLENDADRIAEADYRDRLTRLDGAFKAARQKYSENIAAAA